MSSPRRRGRRSGRASPVEPIKRVTLKVTLKGRGHEGILGTAEQGGLKIEEKAGRVSLSFEATSPDEALDKLRLLAGLLSRKA